MMKTNEQRGVEIMDAIRKVLVNDWDPINIKGFGPDDEYDNYIGGIYRLLASHASEDALIEHLHKEETGQMGTGLKDSERLRPIAQKLLAIDITLKKE